MANSTATLNGVTYISKADYDILYGNGTTHGTIDKTVDGVSKTISYDANKVYIIKEEEVDLPFSKITNGIATSGDVILSTPATASSIWNSILEAKGSTYTFCTQANVLKLINSKAALETNHVTFSGSNGITISTSGTANDATVTFVAPDTDYTLSTLSAGVNQDQEDSFTSSFAYLRLNLSNPVNNIKWTVDNVTNATYATRIGDSTSNYTYSQLVNISSTAATANASAQSAYRAAITNVLSTITDANSTCGYLATTSAICAWAKNYTDSNEKSYTFTNDTTSDILKITPYTGATAGTVCSITINNVKSAQSVNSIGIQTSNGTAIFVDGATGNVIATASAITNYVNQRLTSVYIYKESVDTYSNLPTTEQVIGDVYNVIAEYNNGDIHYAAGTNFAWNGSGWDPLGGEDKLTNHDSGDNANVNFSVGSIGYSKTINNVAHAATATNATYAANVSDGTTVLAATQIMNALTITYLV